MLMIRRAISALLLLGASTAASADERILRYLSDVQIEKDGSLEVKETIDVRAEHVRINHGIFRDFPTRYRGRNGSRVRVGFEFEGALLDGMPVPATTTPFGNGVRIKVGDPDKYVEEGEHTYELHFRTTRQIGRFNGYDELYWNATGNGWIFPIDAAEARIRLPAAVKFGQRSAYTGAQGSTASNAQVVQESPGNIVFQTTAPLEPYQGLTVAVAFPKGVVAEPDRKSRALWWIADYGPPLVGLISLLGLLAFYYVAWQRAGRNPRAGTVVPLFSPPDDLSPPGMRYVMKMASDNRAFASALVDMGVRGHVRLVEEKGGWLSSDKTRIDRLAGANPLPLEERAALTELCMTGDSIMMEKRNYARFTSARNRLAETLKEKYEGKLFKRNYGWAGAGLVLFVAALWVTAAAVVAATDGAEIMQIGVTLGCFAVAAMLSAVVHDLSGATKWLLGLASFIAAAVGFGIGFPILGEALNSGWVLPLLLPALAIPVVVSAFWWMAAPTREGRAVLDRIAGFKQYLSITERERLDRMNPPEDTPAVFERFLPYAIALGVENRWATRFSGVLAAAAAQGQQGFVWYSGSNSPWMNPGGFVDAVGSSLSSTISAASTAPGSSSGSGGGGFSGGGGGGGGGGGW